MRADCMQLAQTQCSQIGVGIRLQSQIEGGTINRIARELGLVVAVVGVGSLVVVSTFKIALQSDGGVIEV